MRRHWPADRMIQTVTVGTVVSTEADDNDVVYGFASVLPVVNNRNCIQALMTLCLEQAPTYCREDVQAIFHNNSNNNNMGLFLQARMVNLPLEIVQVLHQQLVLDLEWAYDEQKGDKTKSTVKNNQQQSKQGGATKQGGGLYDTYLRIAPLHNRKGGSKTNDNMLLYKFFDDELLADHADYAYPIDLVPDNTTPDGERPAAMVILLSRTGHAAAMQALDRMIQSGPSV